MLFLGQNMLNNFFLCERIRLPRQILRWNKWKASFFSNKSHTTQQLSFFFIQSLRCFKGGNERIYWGGWRHLCISAGDPISKKPNMFYFHPYLGKISNLTNIFRMGWNHQPVYFQHLREMKQIRQIFFQLCHWTTNESNYFVGGVKFLLFQRYPMTISVFSTYTTPMYLFVHPGRLTWNLRIHPWKRRIIFQTIIFKFYVNLRGCTCFFLIMISFFLTAPRCRSWGSHHQFGNPRKSKTKSKTTKILGSTRNPGTVTTRIIYILSSRCQTRPAVFTVLGGRGRSEVLLMAEIRLTTWDI